jgi:hypothetical protein
VPISDYTDVTGCQLLLEASRESASDNDLITTWNDASGNARHGTNGGGGARPTYKTNIINGRAVMRFNGSTTLFALPNFLTGFTAGELFAVLKIDTDPPGAGGQTGAWGFGNAGFPMHYPWTDGTIYDDFGSSTRHTTVNPTPSLSSDFRIYNTASEAGAWTSKLDGVTLFSTGTNTVNWRTNPYVGTSDNTGTYWLDGDLALLVLYNSALSSGNRADVMAKITLDYFTAPPVKRRRGRLRW